MIFYYIRHGDPIYDPDSLTALGKEQAQAVAKRLSGHGFDRIYSSTSQRAIDTARPTCEILKKTPELLDFCHETYVWNDFSVETEEGKRIWAFSDGEISKLFASCEMRNLGDRWYEHESFSGKNFKAGIERVYNETDKFFKSLGYEHERYTGRYQCISPTTERVALFAHQGFGLVFLSCLLDIPYPAFSTHFDMTHTGVTVINFEQNGEYCIPKVLTLSSEAHIYAEGLPMKYNNTIDI